MAAGAFGFGKSDKRVVSAPGTPPVMKKKPTLRVEVRRAASPGTKFRIVVANGGVEEVDITGALTAPLAHALWQLRGGADVGNWVDAEGLLDQLLEPTANGDSKPEPEVVVSGKRTTARR